VALQRAKYWEYSLVLDDDEPEPEFWRTTRESKSGSHLGHNGQAAVKVVRKRRIMAWNCRFPAALIVFVALPIIPKKPSAALQTKYISPARKWDLSALLCSANL